MPNRSVFADIQVLFPEQQTTNPVEVFIKNLQGKHRSGRKRIESVRITFGEYRNIDNVTLLPGKEMRSFEGADLTEAIVDFYNKDYWLLSFWNQMFSNASSSSLGREVARAIIKHCVYVTAEDLISRDREVNGAFVRDHGLLNRINYYKKIFNWGDIYDCMRLEDRRRMRERFRSNRQAAIGFDLKRIDFAKASKQIPELNSILSGSDLPRIVAEASEQVENLGGILQTIYLTSLAWRDSGKIRNALREFVRTTP